ncbi:MAG: ComEC/Rec2 family competence protein [Ruminococcus sp.]|jgi:beta-lactamase superfamily II metal-dependent hydrolase
MKLTFVNVGYGEAVLLEWENCTVLIDGGSADLEEFADRSSGRIPIWEYLSERKISHIDLMVNTHTHEDHISGLLKAAQLLPPGELWQSLPPDFYRGLHSLKGFSVSHPNRNKFRNALDDYCELCSLTVKQGGRIRQMQAGQSIKVGPDGVIHILAPSKEKISRMQHSLEELYAQTDPDAFLEKLTVLDAQMNNYSLILMVECQGRRILLPGDTNREGYGGIPADALKADLFKVGHHGQIDGADKKLLDEVAPEAVVCCASSDRRYDSAHPDLIRMMDEAGIRQYFSDCPQVPGIQILPHQELKFEIKKGMDLKGQYR